MANILKINEIFYSIQGESTHAGKPCIFIRLTGCNLRCNWCDTEYAFYSGTDITISQILDRIDDYPCKLVEVTGGEPLLQDHCIGLLQALNLAGYQVLLETGGSLGLQSVPAEVIKIVDFKCPSSGMAKKNNWEIPDQLHSHDEVKFVIGDQNDFHWAVKKSVKHRLIEKVTVLFSPVFGRLKYETLAHWILQCKLPIRFQPQLHKHIWDPEKQGV